MAHNITDSDSIVTARGIRPWHGLGKTLDGILTPAQAIDAAQLAWTVSLQRLVIEHPDFRALPVSSYAVVRMDTATVLGVVGERFTPVQNADLASILDAVVENGARIDTAGSLLGGRIVWFAAALGDYEAAGERHRDFLVISHGHDGTRAVTIRRTSVRVVCWNTLTASDRSPGAYFSVRHTESAESRIGVIGKLIAAGDETRSKFQETAARMAKWRLTEAEQVDFILRSLSLDPAAEVSSIKRKIEAAKAALAWERANAAGDPSSLWIAAQGVTHYLSHETASKGSKTVAGQERRLASLIEGERASIARDAFASAASLVGAGA